VETTGLEVKEVRIMNFTLLSALAVLGHVFVGGVPAHWFQDLSALILVELLQNRQRNLNLI